MKKGSLSNKSAPTLVKRISTSPYFKDNFAELESLTIKNISGAEMLPQNSLDPADILITNTHTIPEKISPQDLASCRLMIHPNSGYDNFSAEFVASVDFPIIIGNPIRAQAVSNYILSALLCTYSLVESEKSWSETRAWPRKLLSELNVLIVGLGHIGSILQSTLTPLVSLVKIYDPHLGYNELNLARIDVVLLTCGLNKENTHLVDSKFLSHLNEDFLLINAARGSLVKTDDLILILKNQPKAKAVLDVFEKEPADLAQYVSLKNLITTSHVAGVYKNIDAATANFEAQVILDLKTLDQREFLHHYKSTNLVNRLSKNKDFLI